MIYLQPIKLLFEGQVHLLELGLSMLPCLKDKTGYADDVTQLRFSVAVLRQTLKHTESLLIREIEVHSDELVNGVVLVTGTATTLAKENLSPVSQDVLKERRSAFLGVKVKTVSADEERAISEVRAAFATMAARLDLVDEKLKNF